MRTQIRFTALVCLCFIFSSCGKSVRDTGEFEPWVRKFEVESTNYGHPLKIEEIIIKMADLELNKNGECILSYDMPQQINIQRSFWEAATPETREILIFHELGHCILFREHNDEFDAHTLRPMSLMRSKILPSKTFKENREQYLKELFDNISK